MQTRHTSSVTSGRGPHAGRCSSRAGGGTPSTSESQIVRLRLCRPAVLGATARLRRVVWKQTHAALKPTSGLVSSTDVCPGTSGRADGPRPESADACCGPFRAGSRPGLRALLALARAVVGDPGGAASASRSCRHRAPAPPRPVPPEAGHRPPASPHPFLLSGAPAGFPCI